VAAVTWTLVVKTWRDRWRGLTVWAVGLVAIIAMELWVYPSIRASSEGMDALMASYPEAFREFFRMSDFASETGFLNVEVFSLIVPLILIAVGASWGSGATADEEEKGTADLLLTLPLSRTRVLLAKAAATVGALLALAAALTASLVVGGLVIDLDISASQFAAASLACALLGLLYSSVALLAGALTGRRGVAMGATIALALAGYLTYSLSPMVDAFESIDPVNPFAWALGPDPLSNGLDAGYSLRLVLLSVVLVGFAVLAYRRRDIRTA
jgi:ABC-2 type transport system permease protein